VMTREQADVAPARACAAEVTGNMPGKHMRTGHILLHTGDPPRQAGLLPHRSRPAADLDHALLSPFVTAEVHPTGSDGPLERGPSAPRIPALSAGPAAAPMRSGSRGVVLGSWAQSVAKQ
jgi:hypothetical protein